jgi:hypothetical protein
LNFRDNLGGIYGVGVFPGDNDCVDLWGCFKFVLCYGLRQGGGIGDIMNLSIGDQWISDLTYFLVVSVMLLNIIFGIIIDTFSSLRADKNERLVDTEEVCFICGIDKQVFDRASDEPDGFKTHIKVDHNMWNYLYYIFMLWEQDRDDDDGLELYVRKAIEADEIIWFPMNKAIRLDHAATEEEQTLADIWSQLQSYEDSVTTKITTLQTEINVYLEQISLATKQSYGGESTKNGIAKFLRDYTANVVIEDGVDTQPDLPRLATPDGLVLDGLEDEDEAGVDDNSVFSRNADDETTPRADEDFGVSRSSKPFTTPTNNAYRGSSKSGVSGKIGFSSSDELDRETSATTNYPGFGVTPQHDFESDDIQPFHDQQQVDTGTKHVAETVSNTLEEVSGTAIEDTNNQLIDLENCSNEASPSKPLSDGTTVAPAVVVGDDLV